MIELQSSFRPSLFTSAQKLVFVSLLLFGILDKWAASAFRSSSALLLSRRRAAWRGGGGGVRPDPMPPIGRRNGSGQLLYAEGDERDDASRNSALTLKQQGGNSNGGALRRMPPVLDLMQAEDDWREWHYSFSRNGYTDFLPQFSEHLSCLMVGGADDGGTVLAGLPWQEEVGGLSSSEAWARITSLRLDGDGVSGNHGDAEHGEARLEAIKEYGAPLGGYLAADGHAVDDLVADIAASMARIHGVDGAEEYDCILDRGLMNAVLSSLRDDNGASGEGPRRFSVAALGLHALLQKATRALREHGIYVLITDGLLPSHIKQYLTIVGEAVGMQWKFDLDGISSDEKGLSVSVARKYFVGELPSFERSRCLAVEGSDDFDSDDDSGPPLLLAP